MKHIVQHIAAGPGGPERVRLFNRALELAPSFGGAQTPAAQIEMWLQAFVAEAEYHFAPASPERSGGAPEQCPSCAQQMDGVTHGRSDCLPEEAR